MKYVQFFKVTGVGEFPFDMLRYDYCYPKSSEDAVEMGYHPRLSSREPRTVELCRHVEFAKITPTAARWASFGWKVEEASVTTRRL